MTILHKQSSANNIIVKEDAHFGSGLAPSFEGHSCSIDSFLRLSDTHFGDCAQYFIGGGV